MPQDGELAHLGHARSEEIAGKIAVLLARFAPGAVLVPCRCDGSSEHDAAFDLVMRALARAGLRPRILEFPVWSWWNPLLLLRPLFACRRIWRIDLREFAGLEERAISAYTSQNLPIAPDSAAALPPGFASMFPGPGGISIREVTQSMPKRSSRKVLIVSPHFAPINAPDMQRVRLALPYLRSHGWEPVVLALAPGMIEGGVNEPLLEETYPKDIRIVRVRGIPPQGHALGGNRAAFGFAAGRALSRSGRPAAAG